MKRWLALAFAACCIAAASLSYARGGESMAKEKKILIIYYSQTGNTERVARDLAQELKADIEKITDKKKRKGFLGYLFSGRDAMKKYPTEIEPVQKDPALYDLVIVGTPVWAWNMTPAIRTYIEQTRGSYKNVAFFTTSGGTAPEKIVGYMEELSGKKAVAFAGFTAQELKDASAYRSKISRFLENMKQHP